MGIVIIEISVVVNRIVAAMSWLVLYASAIKMVETADGVPAWRTTADVSLKSKFKILLTKYMIRGKMNSFKIINFPIVHFCI